MKKYIQICSILLLFVYIASCQGQKKTDLPKERISQPEINSPEIDPYFIESKAITTFYGPTNITRNIIQDKSENFWFASFEGIIRYDGKSFTNFTNKEGLRRFRAFSVLEDRMGSIWFGTIGAGVYFYDGKTFTNFTTKEGLVNNDVGCIYEDKKGHIWFGTRVGISRFDGKTFTNFTTEDGLTNNDVNSIIEDKTGKFWFGTRGDACFYDGKTFTTFTNTEGAPFENVRSIIEDRKGNIWLGGNDGLWRFDRISFTNFTTDFVGYIYEDKKGNIWTSSSESGNSQDWVLSRYDEKTLPNETASAIQLRTQQEEMFFGILEDTKGGIWLGTVNGVYRYDGNTFNDFKDTTGKE